MADELATLREALPEARSLTAEELAQVQALASQIDIQSSNSILNFGVETQTKLSQFSETALAKVRNKDTDEVGEMISGLIAQLKNFDVDKEEKGLKGLFKKQANRVERLKIRYATVEENVNTITGELEKHQVALMKDIDVMDRMYALNLDYFRELSMQILAGRQKLTEVRQRDLVELQSKAESSGLPEDAQAARDLAGQCDRFEKKLHDLELTRTIALQTAPQIRIVQDSDTQMVEKIQSTIINTIPLWKNQMIIALGVEHANEAAKAEREVNDMTNELLRRNADKLKTATIAAAKEAERGIVDIETLQHTNEQLISTLDEVMTIRREGHEKRLAAQEELGRIEDQLKEKLLEASH